MLFANPQTTLAFAPAPEDLEDIDFSVPVIALAPARDDKESEQKEPYVLGQIIPGQAYLDDEIRRSLLQRW